MKRIDFQNNITKVNKATFDEFQNNIEESCVVVSPTEPTTNENVWIQKGKNLLNYKNLLSGAISAGIKIDDDGNISGNIYDSSPVEDGRSWNMDNSNWAIRLPAGTYTISLIYSTKTTSGGGICIYKNGTQIQFAETANLENYNYTFTLEEEAEIAIMLKVYDGVCTIQLEEGTEVTEHEAYVDKKINVDGEEFLDVEKTNNQQNYSTAEQVIGTWIDGKPLYRKTINFGALPNATEKNVAHNISNLGTVAKVWGTTKEPSRLTLVLPVVSNSSLQNNVGVLVSDTNIIITTGIDRTAYTETYVTIEYTKTTD